MSIQTAGAVWVRRPMVAVLGDELPGHDGGDHDADHEGDNEQAGGERRVNVDMLAHLGDVEQRHEQD
jgi:hypothetical protein